MNSNSSSHDHLEPRFDRISNRKSRDSLVFLVLDHWFGRGLRHCLAPLPRAAHSASQVRSTFHLLFLRHPHWCAPRPLFALRTRLLFVAPPRDDSAHAPGRSGTLAFHRLCGLGFARRYGRPDARPLALCAQHQGSAISRVGQHRHRHSCHRRLHPSGQSHEL